MTFEFVNKVMVPRSEKRTVVSAADLFLMEKLSDPEEINLPTIMLENIHRVMTWKIWNHGIPYVYLLNWVFHHFEVPLGMGVLDTFKQMFSKTTLQDCECIEGDAPGCSQVAQYWRNSPFLREKWMI